MKSKRWFTWLAAAVLLMLVVPVAYALGEGGPALDLQFSTSPEPSQETMIYNEFLYSDTRNTFYCISNQPVESVRIIDYTGEDLPYVTSAIDTDGKKVTFTVNTEMLGQRDAEIIVAVESGGSQAERPIILRYNVERLWWRYVQDWGNGYEAGGAFYSDWHISPGYSLRKAFYYGPSGSETPLQITRIESTAPDVVSAEQVGTLADGTATVWRVSITGLGNVVLQVYTDNGEMYSFPVTAFLPTNGFSTSEVLTEETYIRAGTFSYTGVGSEFYYVDKEGNLGFTGATVLIDGEATDAVTCEVVASGKAVKFTVTGTLPRFCQLTATLFTGNTWYQDYLTLLYAGEQLLYGYASNYGGEWTETEWKNPAPLTQSLGASSWFVFYFGTEDAAEGIHGITGVDTSNPNVITAERVGETQTGLPVYKVTGHSVGNASLTIYAGDTVYELPVQVELPYGGFYSSQEATEETYLSDGRFVYTEETNTVYYIIQYPFMLESDDITATIWNSGTEQSVLGDYITCEILGNGTSDRTVVKFTVVKPLPAAETYVSFSFDLGTSGQQHGSLRMVDGSGRLLWLECSWDGGHLTADLENSWVTDGINLTIRPYRTWQAGVFCFGTQENKHILTDITEVTADSGVVTVAKSADTTMEGYTAWEIYPVDVGTTTLTVETGDGKQYAIPVTVNLPQRGFCTEPEMSVETFIRSGTFTCSGESDTFYYVTTNPGDVFSNVEIYTRYSIEGEIIEEPVTFASAEILDGGKVIAVTIDSSQMVVEQENIYFRISGENSFMIGQQEFTVEEGILIVSEWQQINLPQDMQQQLENPSAGFYLGTYDGAGRMTNLLQFQAGTGVISRPVLEEGYYAVFCLDRDGKPLTQAYFVGPDLE